MVGNHISVYTAVTESVLAMIPGYVNARYYTGPPWLPLIVGCTVGLAVAGLMALTEPELRHEREIVAVLCCSMGAATELLAWINRRRLARQLSK